LLDYETHVEREAAGANVERGAVVADVLGFSRVGKKLKLLEWNAGHD